jgi:hypothetical protein
VFSCVFAIATHVAKVSSEVDRPLLLGTHLPQPPAAAVGAQTSERGSGGERERSLGSSSVGPYGHATRNAVRTFGRMGANTAAHEMDDPNSVKKETTKTPNPMGYGVNEETRPTYALYWLDPSTLCKSIWAGPNISYGSKWRPNKHSH